MGSRLGQPRSHFDEAPGIMPIFERLLNEAKEEVKAEITPLRSSRPPEPLDAKDEPPDAAELVNLVSEFLFDLFGSRPGVSSRKFLI